LLTFRAGALVGVAVDFGAFSAVFAGRRVAGVVAALAVLTRVALVAYAPATKG